MAREREAAPPRIGTVNRIIPLKSHDALMAYCRTRKTKFSSKSLAGGFKIPSAFSWHKHYPVFIGYLIYDIMVIGSMDFEQLQNSII